MYYYLNTETELLQTFHICDTLRHYFTALNQMRLCIRNKLAPIDELPVYCVQTLRGFADKDFQWAHERAVTL